MTSGMTSSADPPAVTTQTISRAGGCFFAGSPLSRPSRFAGFPLVRFGAKVASGSSESTMAISTPVRGRSCVLGGGSRWCGTRSR